nr:AzlD domain-containing protein [Galbitalea soli]
MLASVCVLGLKVVGYLVPPRLVERPTPARISSLLTVALLAGLVAVQSLARGTEIVVDARVPAVILAGVLFALRVPFVLVIIAAALCAALLPLAGWMT